jgi:dihydrolipoamide dehydrogenase
MEEISTKVLILGGGPGGYVAAIHAGQLGLPTVLVNEGRLGGSCLNVGCIPSKAIIHVAEAFHQAHARQHGSAFGLTSKETELDFARTQDWKDTIVSKLSGGVAFLLRKNKVTVLEGRAEIVDGKTCVVTGAAGPTRIRAEHLMIATGSQPVEIPSLPFGGPILSSTGLLALDRVPKTLAVVGAGYIGLELGTAFAKLGAKVTVIEAAEAILPAWDRGLTEPVARRLDVLGVTVVLGATVQGLRDDAVLLAARKDGESFAVAAETVLVAVGRTPCTEGFGLERLDLDRDGRFIRVDSRCATSMRNVWAIGDVTGEPMLAHRAMAQGELVADIIAGKRRVFDHNAIPAICFTDPEIVAVGLSPDEARSAGIAVKVGTFPFAANGRALTQADDSGLVRIVARSDDHVVVGIHAVGAYVSELASAFTLAIEMGARAEDIAATVHAHPTRSEAFQEAALAVLGQAIHI